MNRIAFIVFLAALSFLGSSTASAATNEIKFCANKRSWEVTAGNYPPTIPNTKCSFAKATFRTAMKKKKRLDGLPRRFRMTVRRTRLRCTSESSKSYSEIRCRDRKHFVLLYKFG